MMGPNYADKEWVRLLQSVAAFGVIGNDRTGVGTMSLFGMTMEIPDVKAFPALTLKRLAFRSMAAELQCFIRGESNAREFDRAGCRVWNDNAAAWKGAMFPGDMGRVYGVQWRDWRGITRAGNHYRVDQLMNVVRSLKDDPHGRRHLVTAWNPSELDDMCLPPCHYAFQFDACSAIHLDCMVHMRSVDLFLGLPFDVASYALLLHLVAREVGRTPRRLFMTFGNTHIYLNHVDQVEQVLDRAPRPAPRLVLNPEATLWNFTADMASLEGYDPHPPIFAKLNV